MSEKGDWVAARTDRHGSSLDKSLGASFHPETDDLMLQGRTGVFLTVTQRQHLYDILAHVMDEEADGGLPSEHRRHAAEMQGELVRLADMDRLQQYGKEYL